MTPLAQGGERLGTLAVSDCLRGRAVRWDGDHNGDTWPRRVVEQLFELVGICPEVGVGLGVPRPPIRLVGSALAPRAVAVEDPDSDLTARLRNYADRVAGTLAKVDGYVFADRSPSCGLAAVKVFGADGSWRRVGRGVFAAAVCAAHPRLPVVDAETLRDRAVLLDFACAVAARRAGTRGHSPSAAAAERARIARLLDATASRQERLDD